MTWAQEWRSRSRALGSLVGNQAKSDLALGGQQVVDACHLPIHFGGQSGLGQTRADIGGNIDRSNATGVFESFAVGKNDFKHNLQWA